MRGHTASRVQDSIGVDRQAMDVLLERNRAAEAENAAEAESVAAGRRVIEMEAAALLRLARALDGAFDSAVAALAATSGRVMTTGMGKSGHVARKIAATLASTGTPAGYVHPAEARHGDLGMIAPGDTVLALSNSGETAELDAAVDHAGRHGIPLVAIVGRAGSTLAARADIALVLVDAPEACPNGLAPTTSTTMALALGDALAVALMERAGFTGSAFRLLHPGGGLAARLTMVADLMHRGGAVPLVGAEASMSEALVEMTAKSFGCVGIVDGGGRLAGIVTDGDLRRHMAPDLPARPVTEVMTADPRTIAPERLASEALFAMSTHKITALFAVEGGRPVGILHSHDCLRAGLG